MNLSTIPHQYIDRNSLEVITEKPIGDRTIQFLYNTLRENTPAMFRALTSGKMSSLLGYFHYDMLGRTSKNGHELFSRFGADWQECVEPMAFYDSHRKFFERQIRYWETRPMNRRPTTIVSPADARVLIGSFAETSSLFIKDKFFDLEELLAPDSSWHHRFKGGDFAVFRLTPDKYHYNHVPVNGPGNCHLPGRRPLSLLQPIRSYRHRLPLFKKQTGVTIIDTDVVGGTAIGLVAMVEIVALMIGDIVQSYSDERYDNPQDIRPGQMVKEDALNLFFARQLYRRTDF